MLPCVLLRWERITGCHRNLTEEALGDLVRPLSFFLYPFTTTLARLARAVLYRPNRNGGLTYETLLPL
jgi:hypothetical protein